MQEIAFVALDAEKWERYPGAFGNLSEAIEDFLNAPDDKDLAETVYEGINHQMSFYPAAYPAVPYLTHLLEQKIALGDIEWAEYCLFQLGMTLASDNFVTRRDIKQIDVEKEIQIHYQQCTKKLKTIAKQFYKAYKNQLKHQQESFMAHLAIKGFRLLVYEFVLHV